MRHSFDCYPPQLRPAGRYCCAVCHTVVRKCYDLLQVKTDMLYNGPLIAHYIFDQRSQSQGRRMTKCFFGYKSAKVFVFPTAIQCHDQSCDTKQVVCLSFSFGVAHAPFACQRRGLPHRLAQCITLGKGLV